MQRSSPPTKQTSPTPARLFDITLLAEIDRRGKTSLDELARAMGSERSLVVSRCAHFSRSGRVRLDRRRGLVAQGVF